jgi:hypothetical protein
MFPEWEAVGILVIYAPAGLRAFPAGQEKRINIIKT